MEDFTRMAAVVSPWRACRSLSDHLPGVRRPAERETDTMGGFACSSWYFLRFTSPHYRDGPFEPDAMRYWMPVDLVRGRCRACRAAFVVRPLLVKVMADAGLCLSREPFTKLLNQGQLLGPDGVRMNT